MCEERKVATSSFRRKAKLIRQKELKVWVGPSSDKITDGFDITNFIGISIKLTVHFESFYYCNF